MAFTEKESTRKRRPVLEVVLRAAEERQVDIVLCWKLDRFGRSVPELVSNIKALDRAAVRFIAFSQSIDTDQRNPTSKLLLHILASVAEFERDLIRERVVAGVAQHRRMARAGRRGKDIHTRSGKNLRIGGQQRVFDRRRALELHKAGKSIREIVNALAADGTKVSRGTIHSLVRSQSTA